MDPPRRGGGASHEKPTWVIRSARLADAATLFSIYAPIVRETATSFEQHPPSPAKFTERIRDILERFPFLVCEVGGRVAGYAHAKTFRAREAYRWTAETSVCVDAKVRHRGVGTGLYASLIECLRLQGFNRVIAGITLPNIASIALHERFGFQPVGVLHRVGFKLGAWHDVGLWELALRGPTDHPEEPRTISSVLDTPEWLEAMRLGEAAQVGASQEGPVKLSG